ncbi:MAG: efflux RND transporter periplasmic adaptor subunit [Bacteroidales bacterium]|nr:efflux RND transporter periplasmic adaptor subunit [Bacteroidales bacterium]
MKKQYRRGLLRLFLLLPLLLVSCGHPKHKSNAQRAVPVGVVLAGSPAEGEVATPSCEYVGTVEEGSASTIGFATSGRVTAVYVKEGQTVSAGQLLAEIDNTTAQNSYKAAQATLHQAQDGYDRAKLVYQKGSLPEVKWIEVKTQLDQAQSLAEVAKKNLDDCKLYAPCSGTVADRNLEVGSNVTPFQPVMRLLNLGMLAVKVSIPEGDIAQITNGMAALVTVTALDNLVLRAVVDERNVSADPLSHSYMVRLRLQGTAGKKLLPGMVCKVAMGQRAATSGLLLPNRAVQISNDGSRFVWVVEHDKAVRRAVTIGDLSANGVLVSSGLNGGEQVIVDGALKVSEGTNVIIK